MSISLLVTHRQTQGRHINAPCHGGNAPHANYKERLEKETTAVNDMISYKSYHVSALCGHEYVSHHARSM